MTKNVYITILVLFIHSFVFSQMSDSCLVSIPFCSGTNYSFPAPINNGYAETGPDYGCLDSVINPTWLYILTNEPGAFNIRISSSTQSSISIICWGPFTSPYIPCNGGLISSKIIDCDGSAGWDKELFIPAAQMGEFYIFLVSNSSNTVCNINIQQDMLCYPMHGYSLCSIISANYLTYQNPVCAGDTLKFYADPTVLGDTITNGIYHWSFGPVTYVPYAEIPNVQPGQSGYYSCHETTRNVHYGSTWVTIFEVPDVIVSQPVVCVGDTATITVSGADFFQWSTGETSGIINTIPSVDTVLYVIGTNNFICYDTAYSYITVNAYPTSSFILQDSVEQSILPDTNLVSVIYTGNSTLGAQYLWDFSSDAIIDTISETEFLIYWLTTGVKSISLIVVNQPDCRSDTTINFITVYTSTNIPNNTSSPISIEIFPNPTESELFINVLTNNPTSLTIELSGIDGKPINELYNGSIPSGEFLLKTSFPKEISKGVYIINAMSDKNVIVKKLIIK